MKTLLWAVLIALLVPITARADTYWVSPSGGTPGQHTGADSTTHAMTLAEANAAVDSGDVVRFAEGTYTDIIRPNTWVSTPTARIAYYGFPDDPSRVKVAGLMLGVDNGWNRGNYTTVRWITTTGQADGMKASAAGQSVGDSIVACRFVGQTDSFWINSQNSVVDSCTFAGTITGTEQTHIIFLTGDREHGEDYGCKPDSFFTHNPADANKWDIGCWVLPATKNVFKNCTVNMVVNTTTGPKGDVHALLVGTCLDNLVWKNTFNITVTNCLGYFFGVENYCSYSNTIQENTFNILLNGPIHGAKAVWCSRDSSRYNRFYKNTVYVHGTGELLSFMLSNSGTFGSTVQDNYYGYNVIRDSCTLADHGTFYWYDGCRRDTVDHNVIVSTGAAIELGGAPNTFITDARITNNTLLSYGAPAIVVNHPSPTNTVIKGNVFITRKYVAGCNLSWVNKGVCLVGWNEAFGCDSNYFAPVVLGREAHNGVSCVQLKSPGWKDSGNDASSRSGVYTAGMFKDARWGSLDLRPTAHSVLYPLAAPLAPGGHYGALAKP